MTARTLRWVHRLLMALLALAGGAHAEPTPLCQRPEVLQEVARTVRQWDVYNQLEEYSVTEQPTTRANAVVCHAVIRSVGYVWGGQAWEPRPSRVIRRYDVQVEGNRFVVQVPR